MDLKIILPRGLTLNIKIIENKDFYSLNDLAIYKSQNTKEVIRDWIRLKSTLKFLTAWEEKNNPGFQKPEIHKIKHPKGSNFSTMSPSRWMKITKAIGIVKPGTSDSGIFARREIALEFLTWLSPQYKFEVIEELQRLKEIFKF